MLLLVAIIVIYCKEKLSNRKKQSTFAVVVFTVLMSQVFVAVLAVLTATGMSVNDHCQKNVHLFWFSLTGRISMPAHVCPHACHMHNLRSLLEEHAGRLPLRKVLCKRNSMKYMLHLQGELPATWSKFLSAWFGLLMAFH